MKPFAARVEAIAHRTGVDPADVHRVLREFYWLIRHEALGTGQMKIPGIGTLRQSLICRANSKWKYRARIQWLWDPCFIWEMALNGKTVSSVLTRNSYLADGSPRTINKSYKGIRAASNAGKLPPASLAHRDIFLEPRAADLLQVLFNAPPVIELESYAPYSIKRMAQLMEQLSANPVLPLPPGAPDPNSGRTSDPSDLVKHAARGLRQISPHSNPFEPSE